MTFDASFFEPYRLIVSTGAGGVGKTTTAAKIATSAAQAGRHVAVLTIDPARRLAEALRLQNIGSALYTLTTEDWSRLNLPAPRGSLSAMMLNPVQIGDEQVRRLSNAPEVTEEILKNSYYRSFATSLSGNQEFMAVLELATLCNDSRFDLVILDTAPANRALDFLDEPYKLSRALEHSALQAFFKPDTEKRGFFQAILQKGQELAMSSLEALTGQGFLTELSRFLSLFSKITPGIKIAAQNLQSILTHPTTGFLIVTTSEDGPLQDALELRRELARRKLTFAGFLCNKIWVLQPTSVESDLNAVRDLRLRAALQSEFEVAQKRIARDRAAIKLLSRERPCLIAPLD